MSMNTKSALAITTFERPWVGRSWSTKCCINVDLVEMPNRSLVFLKVTFRSEWNSTRVTSKWPLKIMDVNVKPKLCSFGKDLAAEATNRFTILVSLKYFWLSVGRSWLAVRWIWLFCFRRWRGLGFTWSRRHHRRGNRNGCWCWGGSRRYGQSDSSLCHRVCSSKMNILRQLRMSGGWTWRTVCFNVIRQIFDVHCDIPWRVLIFSVVWRGIKPNSRFHSDRQCRRCCCCCYWCWRNCCCCNELWNGCWSNWVNVFVCRYWDAQFWRGTSAVDRDVERRCCLTGGTNRGTLLQVSAECRRIRLTLKDSRSVRWRHQSWGFVEVRKHCCGFGDRTENVGCPFLDGRWNQIDWGCCDRRCRTNRGRLVDGHGTSRNSEW